MSTNRILLILTLVACMSAASDLAIAEDAITAPAQKTIGGTHMVPSLAVLNSRGASLQGKTLMLSGLSPNSIVFADRPVRAAGHVLTAHFLKQWDAGTDSFADDPPNATISVLSRDGLSVKDAVVVLKTPKLEGDNLSFDVEVLEGNLANADGPASLFIDWFAARGGWARGGYGHVAGGRWAVAGGVHRPVYGGAWYGHPGLYGAGAAAAGLATGAALGAAAASAPPPCGYYPNPPC